MWRRFWSAGALALSVLLSITSLPALAWIDEVHESVVGTWRGNDTFFHALTLSNLVSPDRGPDAQRPLYLFTAELSESFCQRAEGKCPADRKVSGTYYTTGSLKTSGNPPRVWFQTDAKIFDLSTGVGSIFHPYFMSEDLKTVRLTPRYDYWNLIRPRAVILTRE